VPERVYSTFTRDESYLRLQEKVRSGKSLVVHTMVALCDNDNQGIVPVNKSLGDGQSPRTNLYWGAMYGVKSHFKLVSNWKLVKSIQAVSDNVLERVVFQRRFSNGALVYLVADAYRGDRMEECIVDFFDSVAGRRADVVKIGDVEFEIAKGADLITFNGHNGLMDFYDLSFEPTADEKQREVAVIGCASKDYFNPHLIMVKGYPLLMTTNLMAPEAYVLEGVIDSWAMGTDGAEIRRSAGAAYHKYQKCGLTGATKLFSTGW
jgi:hypothetical protein